MTDTKAYAEELIDFFNLEFESLEKLQALLGDVLAGEIDSQESFRSLAGVGQKIIDEFGRKMSDTIKLINQNVGKINVIRANHKNLEHWPGSLIGVEMQKESSQEIQKQKVRI